MTQSIVDKTVVRTLQKMLELKSNEKALELRKALINGNKSALLKKLSN